MCNGAPSLRAKRAGEGWGGGKPLVEQMIRYITVRLISMAVMILLSTLIVFLIATQVPADPVLAQLGDLQSADKELVASYRARWGLDLPIWKQYLIFLHGLTQGDFGQSISTHRPVLEDIRQYAPATIELATVSFILAIVIAIPLGMLAAVKRDTLIDHFARFVSLIGVSAPTFWLAFIVLAVFYGGLQIAPGPGRLDVTSLPPATLDGATIFTGSRNTVCHWVVIVRASGVPYASVREISRFRARSYA